MVCLINFINTSGLLSVMTWYLFSTRLMNLVNAVFIRAVPCCSWSWVLYSIVPLVIYAFLYLVGSGDCQKISAGECITCGVYAKGFKQVYGQYMSCFVELNLNCCGMILKLNHDLPVRKNLPPLKSRSALNVARTIAKKHKTLYGTEYTRYFHVKCVKLNTNKGCVNGFPILVLYQIFQIHFFEGSVDSPMHLDVPNEEIGESVTIAKELLAKLGKYTKNIYKEHLNCTS